MVAILLALLCIGAWAVLQALDDDATGRQTRGLSALSASQGAPEDMPKALRRQIRRLKAGKPFHLRFDEAQHARTPIGVGIWIVEGAGITCIFREGLPASACEPTGDTKLNGISLGTYTTDKAHPGRPLSFLALGVVPEGVRAVLARVASSRRAVRVRNGAWAIRAKTPIKIERLVR
jgi:hypothetical protein